MKAIPSIATQTVAWSFRLYVRLSHPAKDVEMPFGRDTCVVPSNTLLDREPGPHGKGRFGVGTPVLSDAACRQIALTLVSCL